MRGRKHLSIDQKIIRGTFRPCRDKNKVPISAKGRPEAPDLLSCRAKDIFNEIMDRLEPQGTLSKHHREMLSLLALKLEEIEVCTAIINEQGMTYETNTGLIKTRPEVAIRQVAGRHAQSLLNEFGLSPAAVQKVKPADEPETDEWSQF